MRGKLTRREKSRIRLMIQQNPIVGGIRNTYTNNIYSFNMITAHKRVNKQHENNKRRHLLPKQKLDMPERGERKGKITEWTTKKKCYDVFVKTDRFSSYERISSTFSLTVSNQFFSSATSLSLSNVTMKRATLAPM